MRELVVERPEEMDFKEYKAILKTQKQELKRYLKEGRLVWLSKLDQSPHILQILAEVHTPFATAGYACIQSSSSNIRTKKRLLSKQKWHIYFVAQEGQDLERFSKTLFEQAVLKGYGNVFISKDGKQHIRTFFDLSVIALR